MLNKGKRKDSKILIMETLTRVNSNKVDHKIILRTKERINMKSKEVNILILTSLNLSNNLSHLTTDNKT